MGCLMVGPDPLHNTLRVSYLISDQKDSQVSNGDGTATSRLGRPEAMDP